MTEERPSYPTDYSFLYYKDKLLPEIVGVFSTYVILMAFIRYISVDAISEIIQKQYDMMALVSSFIENSENLQFILLRVILNYSENVIAGLDYLGFTTERLSEIAVGTAATPVTMNSWHYIKNAFKRFLIRKGYSESDF